jgi:hypothetical protein
MCYFWMLSDAWEVEGGVVEMWGKKGKGCQSETCERANGLAAAADRMNMS